MDENFQSIVIVVFAIGLFLGFYVFLPIAMAMKRGRNPFGWVLLFWLITPFWGVILLLVLGDSKNKICEEIKKEIQSNS